MRIGTLQFWKLTLAHNVVGKGKRLQRQTLSVGCVCIDRRWLARQETHISRPRPCDFLASILSFWKDERSPVGARQWHLSHCLSMSPTDVQILGFRAWIPRPDRIATRLAPVILPRATFPPVSWLRDYFRDVVLTRATCDSASQTP